MSGSDSSKSLEQRTRDYWNLSLGWNGRGRSTTVEKALKLTCNLASTTDPYKPLAARVRQIEHEIIVGKKAKAKESKKSKSEIQGTNITLVLLDEIVAVKPAGFKQES